MKKFAFLLATVAVFAMSACAFAAESGDIIYIGPYTAGMPLVNTNRGAENSVTGTWEESVFYYGSVSEVSVGAQLSIQTSRGAATAYGAKHAGTGEIVYSMAFVPEDGAATNVNFILATPTEATTYAIDTYTVSTDQKVSKAGKTLKVTPAELIVTATKDAEDVKDKPFTVKTTDSTFDIVIDGKAGTADTLDLTKVDVKSGDTDVPTDTGGLVQWLSSTGTIGIDPTRAKAGDSLVIKITPKTSAGAKILETATNASVAGVTANTVFATIAINFVDYIVEPPSAAWDGNAEPPSDVKFTIKDLTADHISKIEITGSGVGSDVLDPANYTATTNGSDVDVELKLEYLEGLSKNDYTFTITGESNKTAEFALSVTPKAEASYAAEPSSATWDGSTAAGVKFKVNMPSGNFNAIGVKRPDADAEDVRELGKDYYTVTPTADGIEIELKPEYLSSLTEAGDYVYSVGDMKGLAALFTLTVTNVNSEVPATGVTLPSDESAPEGVQFGISQRRMRSDEITELDERIGGFLDDDGKIKKDKAAELVNADEDALTVLPIIGTTLDEGKTIAAFTYGVTGSELVSEKVDGIRWYDAIIHKMYVGSLAPASVRLRPVLTWGAIANGTYMILDDNGRLLADDYLVEPNGTRYKLVVYVADNSDYDLDKDPQSVADPVAIQTSSGGSSKSSSGCDAGASLAVLAGLAAIAILKRGK